MRSLDQLAKKHGFVSYADYLSSDHWKKFKELYATSQLPRSCVACNYPYYFLQHIRFDNFGREELGDVLPFCNRCFREVRKRTKNNKPLFVQVCPILQTVFKWTAREVSEKFAPFRPHWKEIDVVKRRPVKPKDESPRHVNDFYKIARDFQNLSRYIKNGYTPEQVAAMYQVQPKYVYEYMSKYPEYF